MAEPAYAFLRVMIQTRKKKHTATGAMCYRFGDRGTSLFAGDDGEPREYDFTPRAGIGPQGCALPEGAGESWRDRHVWAHRIEEVDTRSDARQCRDTVIGIPRELRDRADELLGRVAQLIAEDEGTPAHWVIHDLDKKNPHGHILYAGRRLDGPDAFAAKRDTRQNWTTRGARKSIVDRHREHLVTACREMGVELSFEPKGEKAQEHIGPQPWARERKAIQVELAETIADALNSPIDTGDALKAAREAMADLTVTDALAMDRDPVTPQMIDARKPIRETARIALDPPGRVPAAPVQHETAVTPAALPAVALDQTNAAAAARIALSRPEREAEPVTLDPPERVPAAPQQHRAPAMPAPAPAVSLPQATPEAARAIALDPPERRATAPVRHRTPTEPTPAPVRRLDHPAHRAARPVRLPVPAYIQEKRRMQDAAKWEAEQRERRKGAARSRLESAITPDTAEAVAESMIESVAGHASAWPSFVEHGLGSEASGAAVDALRPHVERHHVPKRDRRQNARTHRQYYEAVKRAIAGFRRWWRGGRGLFGSGPSNGETITETIRETVWPTHWHETETQHRQITEKLRADRERERRRQEQRTRERYRPQLVETTPARAKKPGEDRGPGPGQGGGFER